VERQVWVRLHTRRVIAPFLELLALSHGWSKIFLITPWISEITEPGLPTLRQLAKRLRDESATAYVVTRPPRDGDDWHESALATLERSRRANIVLVPELHTKLYCASTAQADFALFGSANLTQKSLRNIELGAFLNGSGGGRQLFRDLVYEAAQIYRSPTRTVRCNQSFD
jgi:hypothetical protein